MKVFNGGFGNDKSIYQGPPSKENNAAWEDLYNCKETATNLTDWSSVNDISNWVTQNTGT
jgi:hypothetical protein